MSLSLSLISISISIFFLFLFFFFLYYCLALFLLFFFLCESFSHLHILDTPQLPSLKQYITHLAIWGNCWINWYVVKYLIFKFKNNCIDNAHDARGTEIHIYFEHINSDNVIQPTIPINIVKIEGGRFSRQKRVKSEKMQHHNHNTNGEVLNGLIIEDNGIGMSPLALHRMLSFGHCDKVIIFKFLCTIILIFSNLETNRWFDSYWPLWKWFQIWYDWILFKKWLTIQLWRVNANRKGCSCVYKRQRNAKCWISITSMNFNHSYKEITFSLLFF